MRAVVQRVATASVLLKDTEETVGSIQEGLLAYIGVVKGDTQADTRWMAEKLSGLRIFQDSDDKMNLSVGEAGGEILLVSQFTLGADARKGRRPSFNNAEEPHVAEGYLEELVKILQEMGFAVATGRFGARMTVRCDVDGPVTILLDSRKLF